jgi:hypothetical protein
MRGGVAGVDRSTSRSIQHNNGSPRLREQIRGRQTGNPRSDDNDVRLEIAVEFAESPKIG